MSCFHYRSSSGKRLVRCYALSHDLHGNDVYHYRVGFNLGF